MDDERVGWSSLREPADELPHEPTGASATLPWKDTWWFCWRDDEADVSGAVHLTASPNRLPGFRATVAIRWGRREFVRTAHTAPELGSDTVGCELVRLQVLNGAWTEEKDLRLRVDGDGVRADLRIRGRFCGPDLTRLCPGVIPQGTGIDLVAHCEQGTTVEGGLVWGGETVPIDGYGYRDRSWGYRKSDKMALAGWTFGGVHVPRAMIGILGWQSSDLAGSANAAPLPTGIWMADETGVVAATAGSYVRSSEARPSSLDLTFADGREVHLAHAVPTAELFYAVHDAELDGPAIGSQQWDQHVRFEAGDTPASGIFNHGMPFLADVFRNSRFCFERDGVAG